MQPFWRNIGQATRDLQSNHLDRYVVDETKKVKFTSSFWKSSTSRSEGFLVEQIENVSAAYLELIFFKKKC